MLAISISGLLIWAISPVGFGAEGMTMAVSFWGLLGQGACVNPARPCNKRDSMIRTLGMTSIFD
jgi:hypothetical protein